MLASPFAAPTLILFAQKYLSVVQTDYCVAQDAIGAWRDKTTQLETQLGAAVQRQHNTIDIQADNSPRFRLREGKTELHDQISMIFSGSKRV